MGLVASSTTIECQDRAARNISGDSLDRFTSLSCLCTPEGPVLSVAIVSLFFHDDVAEVS